jgi:hypothetical protein
MRNFPIRYLGMIIGTSVFAIALACALLFNIGWWLAILCGALTVTGIADLRQTQCPAAQLPDTGALALPVRIDPSGDAAIFPGTGRRLQPVLAQSALAGLSARQANRR